MLFAKLNSIGILHTAIPLTSRCRIPNSMSSVEQMLPAPT